MAQKILLRRGGISNIGSTIAVTKGELIYASGSNNGVENVVFVANADGNNTFTPVNKLYSGTAVANSFPATLNGTPYYKTDSQALFILNNAGSTALDLSGNLEGTTISSITATGSFSGSFAGNGSGLTNLSLASMTAPGSTTEVLFNNGGAVAATSNLKVTATALDATTLNINTSGNITGSNLKLTGNAEITGNVVIGGNITVGDATTDFVNFGAEISSSFIPDVDSAFDLGSTTKYWKTVYADNFSGSAGSIASVTTLNATSVNATGTISGSALHVVNNATIEGTLTANTGLVPDTDNGAHVGQPAQRFKLYGVDSSISGSFSGSFNGLLSGNIQAGVDLFSITGAGAGSGTDLIEAGDTLTFTNTSTDGFSFTVSSNQVALNTPQDLRTTSSPAFLGLTAGNITVGVSTDNTITTSTGNLTLDSTGGTLVVNDTLDLNGTADISGNITLSGNSQTVTHSGTGNLTISSTSGNTLIEGTTFAGNDVTIPGNLTVQGTTTTIDSTVVNIGDNIIVLNAAGTVADGGIQVRDTTGTTGTGSLLWNATSDYWYAGVSGSTHYRLTTYDNASPAANSIQKVDSNGRLVASLITDNGSTVTVAGAISGSTITASTGFVATGLTGVIDTSSRAIFRDGSNRLGALASTDSAVEVSTVLGYKADGTFVATSIIDGGTF